MSDDISESSGDEGSLGSLSESPTTFAPIFPLKSYSCMCCAEIVQGQQPLLEHLLKTHSVVIADVEKIADLQKYLSYWRERLQTHPVAEFASQVKTNGPDGPGLYYLFSDILPEDKTLRENIQQQCLAEVINRQQKERSNTTFSRKCLFCSTVFTGNRNALLKHLYDVHHLHIGSPDNIVDLAELLDVLQTKMDNLQCIYCEKTFKSYPVLRLHMKKKQHCQINPKNKSYDRFYIVNYLEPGKTWEDIKSDSKYNFYYESESEDEGDEWDGWESDGSGSGSVEARCLFCEKVSKSAQDCFAHMKDVHSFDFPAVTASLALDFYGNIKLVNFIRRQVLEKRCIKCDTLFETTDLLMDHMKTNNHFALDKEAALWNNSQFLIPVVEDDGLLVGLDNADDDGDAPVDNVIPEQDFDESRKQELVALKQLLDNE